MNSKFSLLVAAGAVVTLSSCSEDFKVERSTTIDAPIEVVFKNVQYFENQNAWSPWLEMDPEAKVTMTGEDGTVGAISAWDGEEVGVGEQELKEIVPNERVTTELRFSEPWEATNKAQFLVSQGDDGVSVTWTLEGTTGFPMSLFMNMDEMVGSDYEKGLANLKALCEDAAAASDMSAVVDGFTIETSMWEAKYYVTKRDTVRWADMGSFFMDGYGELYKGLGEAGVEPAGPASAMYWTWDTVNQQTYMACAVPISSGSSVGEMELETAAFDKALMIVNKGSYETSEAAHMAMGKYMMDKGVELAGPVMEEYVVGPNDDPDTNNWVTNIVYPVK